MTTRDNFVNGQYVTCKIQGKKITDARINVSASGKIYICQNFLPGTPPPDSNMFGYMYSWVLDGNVRDLKVTSTASIFADEEVETTSSCV